MAGEKGRTCIGTHNGGFHCDEVLACFMLKLLPTYKDAEIIRDFRESMSTLCPGKKWVTKLSSAGLIYNYYGRDILSKLLDLEKDDPKTELIFDKVYEYFIEEIDGIDNGIEQYDGTPRYKITTMLSSQVGSLNPGWNQTGVDDNTQFNKAMDLVGKVFLEKVTRYKEAWLPAREVVQAAIERRYQVDESGEIICLEHGSCPWQDHLFTLEKDLGITPPIKYVLYEDKTKDWRIKCVPKSVGSFQTRLSLPDEWCGLKGEELSEKCGIPHSIFVHASGFLGGNKNYKGILRMAQKSLRRNIGGVED